MGPQNPNDDRFMVDPSLLLLDGGRLLLDDPALASNIVVSSTFVSALGEGQDDRIAPFLIDGTFELLAPDRRDALLSILAETEQFSASSSELPDVITEIRDALLQLPSPSAEILADEWVYLTTHSWLTAKTRHLLDKLKEVHAHVDEYRGKLVHEMIAEVVPEAHIPETLTPRFLVKVGAKASLLFK